MKRLSLIGFFLILLATGCEKGNDNEYLCVAKVVGYDPNCSTCILSFPYDSQTIKKILGESPDNYYNTVNLNKEEYQIGQMLKVSARKAKDNELNACITLYPTPDFENIYISDYQDFQTVRLNGTFYIHYNDCLYDCEKKCYICFDSVLTDSRCPLDVECFWAGEAIARLRIEKYGENPLYIDIRAGQSDVVAGDYKISFLELSPYPRFGYKIDPEDYVAKIEIKNLN